MLTKILQVSNFKEPSHSREANSHSGGQEILLPIMEAKHSWPHS